MKPKTNLKKPCGDCPFRTNSTPGWLGPWNAVDLHRFVMAEQPFSCHETIDYDDQPVDETELCAGSVLYMKKNCKTPRDAWLRAQQERLAAQGTEGILWQGQFIKRHEGGMQHQLNIKLQREADEKA